LTSIFTANAVDGRWRELDPDDDTVEAEEARPRR
jgi:hypothetical protein